MGLSMKTGDLIRSRRRGTAYYEEHGFIRGFVEYQTVMLFLEHGIKALGMGKVMHPEYGQCWIELEALEVLDETR